MVESLKLLHALGFVFLGFVSQCEFKSCKMREIKR